MIVEFPEVQPGQQKINYQNGEFYIGELKRQGQGKQFDSEGKLIYDGQWKDDLKHGNGKESFSNGDTYDGQYTEGLMHGHGKYTYAKDNSTYFGQFEKGKRHGYGILEYENRDKFVGQWKDDEMVKDQGQFFQQ